MTVISYFTEKEQIENYTNFTLNTETVDGVALNSRSNVRYKRFFFCMVC